MIVIVVGFRRKNLNKAEKVRMIPTGKTSAMLPKIARKKGRKTA